MDQTLARRIVSDGIERFPILYNRMQAFRLRSSPALKRVVTKNHALVIEGFPRCANSFSVRAFQLSNDPARKMKIATHLHSPASILLGVKWEIPTLVLIRKPDDALPSLLSLSVQLNKTNKLFADPEMIPKHVRYWTQRYASFYERLMEVRSEVVIGEFDAVTSNFNETIMALNEKFQCKFRPFEHTEENVEKIFDSSKVHLSPSPERDALKKSFKDCYFSEENQSVRERAQQSYEAFRP